MGKTPLTTYVINDPRLVDSLGREVAVAVDARTKPNAYKKAIRQYNKTYGTKLVGLSHYERYVIACGSEPVPPATVGSGNAKTQRTVWRDTPSVKRKKPKRKPKRDLTKMNGKEHLALLKRKADYNAKHNTCKAKRKELIGV